MCLYACSLHFFLFVVLSSSHFLYRVVAVAMVLGGGRLWTCVQAQSFFHAFVPPDARPSHGGLHVLLYRRAAA